MGPTRQPGGVACATGRLTSLCVKHRARTCLWDACGQLWPREDEDSPRPGAGAVPTGCWLWLRTPAGGTTSRNSEPEAGEQRGGPGVGRGTYSVTPADQMSTLKPEKVSRPLAISGGWKAGEPWLVRQVSSSANGCRACDRARGAREPQAGALREPPAPVPWGEPHLGHAQVGDLERAAGGEQQVARLDVLVHDALAVQVLQAIHQLAEVPAGHSGACSQAAGPALGPLGRGKPNGQDR